ncbi:hypothetical protein E1091_01280 [Micromonospora fluostatini]|uniref:Uncharacterized protein n=1 Tax=Micromonospora fluostatini TaxID=1629071 RepID=A0ABY2DP04_9ACTN|nr:hypothetical protein E1091_01280 [Micromonospora fluostatini]
MSAEQELKRAAAAHEEILAAVRRGGEAALERAQRELGRVSDELTVERIRRVAALAQVARAQQHTGQVYRRVRGVDELVDEWERELPAGFVAAVRALTRPDFAEMLGAQR